MNLVRPVALGVLALLWVGAAKAQAPAPAERGAPFAPATARAAPRPGLIANPDSALALALAEIEGDPLALEPAIEWGIANSTIARDAEAALYAARGAVMREKGAFDPTLFAGADWRGEEQPSASAFARPDVSDNELSAISGGLGVTVPQTGTQITATLESSRLDTNSEFSGLDPEYDAAGKLAVRQPVLKGFGPAAHQELAASERALESANERYVDAILTVRADVERTYWDLYAAARNLAVQRLIRDGAEALARQAELRAGAGLVGPGDVANARVFLAEQEQSVIDREEEMDRISDNLASLLGRRPPPDYLRYRPTAEPPRDFAIESPDTLVARAVRWNRQLAARERDVAAVQALADGAAWDALPALDLYGSLGGVGLSGDAQVIEFGGETYSTRFTGDRGDAVGDALDRRFQNWSAGAVLDFPLFRREGRGERDRLRAEVRRAEERYREARNILEEDVRAAHRELANSERRLAAAEDGVDAAVEQVRIGSLEYQAGRTTAFELVRLAGDLATAQQRYSQAIVRVAKADAELRRLTAAGHASVPLPN
jgi:outer membrane protein TolC